MDTKSILNIENYKKNIDDSIYEIFNQYLKIINKYNETIITSIHVNKHDYFKYIYLKGIESLTYIFNMLIMYTKNLSLTYYHCEKSLFYYIEFIGQIGDDNHSFLQLSSKDAILFVYKKTIFDINDSYKKNMNNSIEDTKIIDKIILYTEIYKNCINLYVNTNNIDKYNEIQLRNDLYCDIFKSIDKLFNNINNLKSKNNNYLEYLKNILSLLLSKQYSFNNENLSYLLTIIIKNIDKKKAILNILTNINSIEFDENYNNISYIKTNLTN
tara:strand:+ start:377 stop:1186 length:810 start_codon:yes stop_codon:yes gene_type:complete